MDEDILLHSKPELKQMSLSQLFDTSFRLMFRNFKVLFLIQLIFISIEAVTGLLELGFLLSFSDEESAGVITRFILRTYVQLDGLQQSLLQLITSLKSIFLIIFQNAVLFHLYITIYLGEKWSWQSSLDLIKSRFGTILGAMLLVYLMIGAGLFAVVIGSFVMYVFTIFVLPAVIHERKKAGAAISRSFGLVSKNFWGIAGSLLLFSLILLSLSMIWTYGYRLVSYVFSHITGDEIYDITIVDYILGTNIPDSIPVIIIIALVKNGIYFIYRLIYTALAPLFPILLFFNQKIIHENFGIEKMVLDFGKAPTIPPETVTSEFPISSDPE